MLIQELFTRNVMEAILMPITEGIRKPLEVGIWGIKCIKIIRQQVRRSVPHYVSLR